MNLREKFAMKVHWTASGLLRKSDASHRKQDIIALAPLVGDTILIPGFARMRDAVAMGLAPVGVPTVIGIPAVAVARVGIIHACARASHRQHHHQSRRMCQDNHLCSGRFQQKEIVVQMNVNLREKFAMKIHWTVSGLPVMSKASHRKRDILALAPLLGDTVPTPGFAQVRDAVAMGLAQVGAPTVTRALAVAVARVGVIHACARASHRQ